MFRETGISQQISIHSRLCNTLLANIALLLLMAIRCQTTILNSGPDLFSLIIRHDCSTSHKGGVSQSIKYSICMVSLRFF